MSRQTVAETPLDARVLEERTQVVGRELFERARQEHAHLSVLNRWTAQVLSWCLSDPSLKANVLRFIDVLPSLGSAAEIARHVLDYFPRADSSARSAQGSTPGGSERSPDDWRLPAALRIGSSLAGRGLLTQRALSVVVKQLVEQVARQFIAESEAQGASRVVRQLALRGASCSLDVLGEQVVSEAEAQAYVAQCSRLLEESAAANAQLLPSAQPMTCGPRVNLSVKPSALSARFDPIAPASSIDRAADRMTPLLHLASQHGALINLDMEQYELRDLTIELAKHLLVRPQTGARSRLGVVIQAYLLDAEPSTEELLAWLASHERALTVRLVKGAYWDSEVAQARQRHWPIPVYQRKTQTDAAFERLTCRLLKAHPLVTVAIASHNVRSIAHAMAAAELLGRAPQQLEFQLLYGMGDALHAAIVTRGYPVRVYTPIGQLIPGMAYLVRRLLENTANESFLRQECLQERSADELLRAPEVSSGPTQLIGAATVCEDWRAEPLADFSNPVARRLVQQALEALAPQLGVEHPLILDGRQVWTRRTLSVRNPSSPSQLIGRVAVAGCAEADQAVLAAQQAQPPWARAPVAERVACLRRAASMARERRHELTARLVVEVGKPWKESDAEVVETIEYLEYYGWRMAELAHGRALAQLPGERNDYQYVPRGVAVVIAPWNFPAAIFTGMAAAALIAGNAVILKPAEQSSVIGAQLARLLADAGVPRGVVQCLPGSGEEVGNALVRHPGTPLILFTGSKAIGLSIIAACGVVQPGQRFVKRAVVEMGGKNAVLIDADADLDAAVQGVVRSAYGYAGQKCSAASRVIVHRTVYDRFLARLIAAIDSLIVGDPADPANDLGPVIEAAAQRRLDEAIGRAAEVATVAYRYPSSRMPSQGYFVGPAVVTELAPDDWLARDELFGPILCVFRADSFEEALALANDTDYALTGGVYSRSPSHIERAIEAFDVGNLYVNRSTTGAMVGRQPFGGHRLSGLGTKAGGPDYLLEMVVPKTICANTTRYGMPLE